MSETDTGTARDLTESAAEFITALLAVGLLEWPSPVTSQTVKAQDAVLAERKLRRRVVDAALPLSATVGSAGLAGGLR